MKSCADLRIVVRSVSHGEVYGGIMHPRLAQLFFEPGRNRFVYVWKETGDIIGDVLPEEVEYVSSAFALLFPFSFQLSTRADGRNELCCDALGYIE